MSVSRGEAFETSLRRAFDSFEATLSDARERTLRRAAFERFAAAGLPHRRLEAWKYTDLPSLAPSGASDEESLDSAAAEAAEAAVEAAIADAPIPSARRAVFVDGVFRSDLSTLDESASGVSFSHLSASSGLASVADDDAIGALSAAFASEGAALRFSGRETSPIEVLFVHVGARARPRCPRLEIVVDDDSEATLIERHVGSSDDRGASSVRFSARLGARSRTSAASLRRREAGSLHLSSSEFVLSESSVLRHPMLWLGDGASRHDLRLRYEGEGADAEISTACRVGGDGHGDFTMIAEHLAPGCRGRERFKAAVSDRGRAVFQGRVEVRREAQRTDSKQSAHALLLSEEAEFDAKPELEIFADDVVCGHGATSGRPSEEALFYLRARGVDEASARRVLADAFLADVFSGSSDSSEAELLEAMSRRASPRLFES